MYPLLSSYTYLTSAGGPDVILNQTVTTPTVLTSNAFVAMPAANKHVLFRGDLRKFHPHPQRTSPTSSAHSLLSRRSPSPSRTVHGVNAHLTQDSSEDRFALYVNWWPNPVASVKEKVKGGGGAWKGDADHVVKTVETFMK
jgi:hypothetical protein